MTQSHFNPIITLLLSSVSMLAHAGTPVWDFTPLTSTTITVNPLQTATVEYLVTNQSNKTHTLAMTPIPGVIQETGAGDCPNPFTLNSQQSCTLALSIVGATLPGNIVSGPEVCQAGSTLQCYQPTQANSLNITHSTSTTTLATSVQELILSVSGYTEYGVAGSPPSGMNRIITVTNTGSNTAENLSVQYPTWPAGTTAMSTCGSTLSAGSSCTITITPDSTATSDCTNGTSPTPGNIGVLADNAIPVSTSVVILGYACQYAGGYVFALDDTPAATASVGGKVVTLANQTSSIIWSSNGNGGTSADVDNTSIYGVSEISTTASADPSTGQVAGQLACDGNLDGACDTNNIYVYYQTYATNSPINLDDYAAGLCKQTISGYSNWYLPAICELTYEGFSSLNCGNSSTPALQNMQSNLVDLNMLDLLSGGYWSATESSLVPANHAFVAGLGTSPTAILTFKSSETAVRCARAF